MKTKNKFFLIIIAILTVLVVGVLSGVIFASICAPIHHNGRYTTSAETLIPVWIPAWDEIPENCPFINLLP